MSTPRRRPAAEGDFSIAGLFPGNYTVAVEAAGFKKLTRAGVALDANDKLALGDLALEVGAVTESIEVSAQAAAAANGKRGAFGHHHRQTD